MNAMHTSEYANLMYTWLCQAPESSAAYAAPVRAQQAGLTRFMLRNINWIN